MRCCVLTYNEEIFSQIFSQRHEIFQIDFPVKAKFEMVGKCGKSVKNQKETAPIKSVNFINLCLSLFEHRKLSLKYLTAVRYLATGISWAFAPKKDFPEQA